MDAPEKESPKKVIITFHPLTPDLQTPSDEYQKIWEEDGEKIIKSFKSVTGMEYPEESVDVIIHVGMSYSGGLEEDQKMRLRGKYRDGSEVPLDRKKAVLVHELGHRHLMFNGIEYTGHFSGHQVLDLFLYDVWVSLYGQEFADSAVEDETRIPNPSTDYKGAWEYALNMTPEQRKQKFQEIIQSFKKSPQNL